MSDFEDFQDIADFESHSVTAKHESFEEYSSRLSSKAFYDRYRMKKSTFVQLFEMLQYDEKTRGNFFGSEFELLILLRYLATGSFMEVCGDLFQLSKTSSHRAIHKSIRKVCSHASRVIKIPQNTERIKFGFRSKCQHFKNVIGAVDGTHIRIKSPGGENPEIFRNRKGYFSINVQAICDHRCSFTDVVIRWPGSTHDARMFDNSVIKWRLSNNQFGNGFLLGDSGYALKKYCITPFANPSNRAEERFNKAHSSLRMAIERAFGMLKRRFPALSFGVRLKKLEDTCALITAAFVLHNICIVLGDEIDFDGNSAPVQIPFNDEDVDEPSVEGIAVREEIKAKFE